MAWPDKARFGAAGQGRDFPPALATYDADFQTDPLPRFSAPGKTGGTSQRSTLLHALPAASQDRPVLVGVKAPRSARPLPGCGLDADSAQDARSNCRRPPFRGKTRSVFARAPSCVESVEVLRDSWSRRHACRISALPSARFAPRQSSL